MKRSVAALLVLVACGGGAASSMSGATSSSSSTSSATSASGAGGVSLTVGSVGATGGCSDAGPHDVDTCSDAGAAHYATDVAPILAGCTGEICHQAWTIATTVGVPSTECCDRALVAPGDPNASYLVDKIEGRDLCSGSRMPYGKAPLPGADIEKIVAWVCAGAKDD